MLKLTLLFSLVFLQGVANQKVLICTHGFNRPDFIEIQYRTFNKFLHDDYEFVVFNDASNESLAEQIQHTCEMLGLRHIRIPQFVHTTPYLERLPGEALDHPTVRAVSAIQYSLDTLGLQHDGIFVIIDSDMFLIRDFSISQYMKDKDLMGVSQSASDGKNGVYYIWTGLVFLNMQTLPDKETINFNCGRVDNIPCDAGGYTAHYLRNHPNIRTNLTSAYYIDEQWMMSAREAADPTLCYLLEQKPNNIEFLLDFTFLHYRGGSNWDYKTSEYHKRKTEILNSFIDKILTF